MATLKIYRNNQWYGSVRDFKIYLDNQKIGELGKGDSKDFTIPEGKHELFAKIDWFETSRISLNLKEDEEMEIVLKSSKKSKLTIPLILIFTVLVYLSDLKLELLLLLFLPIALFLIYSLTIGKYSFLELEQ